MEKDILKRCEAFNERIKPFMSEYLLNVNDARNLIKMCPYCGVIWFKTEGCNGATTCGKRVKKRHDFVSKPFRRIMFYRDNFGRLKWRKQVMPEMKEVKMPKSSKQEVIQGCGNRIVWSEMTLIEEEKIQELFNVSSMDKVNELVREVIEKDHSLQFNREYDTDFYQ